MSLKQRFGRGFSGFEGMLEKQIKEIMTEWGAE